MDNKFQQKRDILEDYGWIPLGPPSTLRDGWFNPETVVHYNDTNSAFEALAIQELTLAIIKRKI